MSFDFYSVMNEYEIIKIDSNEEDKKKDVVLSLYYVSQTCFKIIYLDVTIHIRLWDIMREKCQEIELQPTFSEMEYPITVNLYPENIEYSAIPHYIHSIPFPPLIANKYEIKDAPLDISVFLYYISPYKCKIYARSLYDGWNDPIILVIHDCFVPYREQMIVLSENHFVMHSKYWIVSTDVEIKPYETVQGDNIPSILVESEQPDKKTREKYYTRMCFLHSHPQFTYMCFTPSHQRRFIRTYFSPSIVNIYDLSKESKNELFHLCFLYIMGGYSIDLNINYCASDASLYQRIETWNEEMYAQKIDKEEYSIVIVENPFQETFSFFFDISRSILSVSRMNGWFVDLQVILLYQDKEYPISIGNCIFMNEKKINVHLSYL
jgi:hypothetical protein